MSEFQNDEQRETYVNALLQELAEDEGRLEAAKNAGKPTDGIEESIASDKAELKRVGVNAHDDEVKAKVAEKRPAKARAETR